MKGWMGPFSPPKPKPKKGGPIATAPSPMTGILSSTKPPTGDIGGNGQAGLAPANTEEVKRKKTGWSAL